MGAEITNQLFLSKFYFILLSALPSFSNMKGFVVFTLEEESVELVHDSTKSHEYCLFHLKHSSCPRLSAFLTSFQNGDRKLMLSHAQSGEQQRFFGEMGST